MMKLLQIHHLYVPSNLYEHVHTVYAHTVYVYAVYIYTLYDGRGIDVYLCL